MESVSRLLAMLQLLGRCLLSLLVIVVCVTTPADGEQISIVVDRPLPSAARRALDELRQAITNHGDGSREVAALDKKTLSRLIVGVAGNSPQVDAALKASEVTLGEQPESFAIGYSVTGKMDRLIAGRDERGVTYALREAARAVELTPRESPVFSGLIPANETPFLRVRNVSVHLFNADCERDWYFDDAFWHYYFKQLSFSRFNHFTLTFSDQTNYLCPLYAYLVEMPEYPNVKVEEVSTLERAKNLAMLRKISDLAAEYGIDFNLGIWMQAPVERWSATVRVTGLPQGLEHAQYCALGLRRILDECPSIRGVQLRMNAEAGVNEEQQTDFYRPMFRAIREVGRPIRLELRYKGLQPSTTQAAIDEKLDVTVSTKYWAEHFGLPYHPTSVDSHWREDRYSFGAMLKKPRPYRVVYQLWNVGSQRISLWGDPDYARRFVESCTLGGGEGFEVFAPLTNQGYGDKPGAWDVIADPAYRVGRWPQERYWFFYLCFGRLGYNPKTNAEVWRREFRERFGESAQDIESAYRAASQVLPLITATRLPGASEWSWWPEMDTGGDLREYARIQPSDPRQFYAIRTWQKTEKWRWEEWDETPGYVEDLLAGKVRGKWTPWQIADRLEVLAKKIDERPLISGGFMLTTRPDANAATTAMRNELALLSHLARFHAARLQAAINWEIYQETGLIPELRLARMDSYRSLKAWQEIQRLERIYHSDLVFGVSADSPRSKFGHHHTGKWSDRLSELKADLKRIEEEVQKPRVALTRDWATINYGRQRTTNLSYQPPANITYGRPLAVQVGMPRNEAWQRIILHHRPLDQTRDWRELEMTNDGEGKWSATIPADQIDPQFDFQYYFELLDKDGGTLWPDLFERTPYLVVPVQRR